MIQIFYGDDRVRAKTEITKELGQNYEVYEGSELTLDNLPSLFLGNSLFDNKRSILIRDFLGNKAIAEKLPEYLNTPHCIIIFELKLDKRSAVFKALKSKINFREFSLPKNPNASLIFDIYKVAKNNGKKALAMLEKIKTDEEPMMFFGLMVSQAIKDYDARQGIKEKRALKELSKLDLDLKSTSFQPWLLIESFLLRLSSL